ncbi:MAG: hypothetical protein EOM51_08300 [Clostridia bacterium]|nr:hypothetical protein [Clostridia bacterium]
MKGKSTVIKKDSRLDKRNYVFLFFVLFGLIFVRYCYYGFDYFYQLDDYIQYHNYTADGQGFFSLVKNVGLLSSRPLAGILDFFVWSRFYGNMILAVGLISAMYAASAVLLHKVFSKHFGTGYLFFVVFALMPLGFEGTYWVSASSRIVVGLFFAALSFYFFDAWCEKGVKRSLVLFALFQFLAFCLYEQLILLSGALTLILMLINARKSGRKRALWSFFMFINAILYLGITKLMPTGVYGERTALFLPWQENYGEQVLTPLFGQLKTAFLSGTAATWGKGLLRGFKLIISQPNILYVLCVLALCAALYFLTKKTRRESISFFAELFSGIFLAIVPLLLFFVLKAPWLGLRNTLCSFCGLALIADALFDLVFGKLKFGKTAEAVIASVLALLCCVASVSELHDYRETTIADTQIASAAAEAFINTSFDEDDEIWLLNVNASYVSDGNLYYHEHDYGVTSSLWAMTGAVRAISDRLSLPTISPISTYAAFSVAESELTKAKAFYYEDGVFVRVTIAKASDNLWTVTDSSGRSLGTLSYVDGGLWLKMK